MHICASKGARRLCVGFQHSGLTFPRLSHDAGNNRHLVYRPYWISCLVSWMCARACVIFGLLRDLPRMTKADGWRLVYKPRLWLICCHALVHWWCISCQKAFFGLNDGGKVNARKFCLPEMFCLEFVRYKSENVGLFVILNQLTSVSRYIHFIVCGLICCRIWMV